jgi:hypothetical protein
MARARISSILADIGRAGKGGNVRATGATAAAGATLVRPDRLFPHETTSKKLMMMKKKRIIPLPFTRIATLRRTNRGK